MQNMLRFPLRLAGVVAMVAMTAAITPVIAQEMTSGEVRKVDESASKITIKHGPLKHLDMDMPMTMVFAADAALVKQVKPGDKIMFEAKRVNGQLTVTKIDKSK